MNHEAPEMDELPEQRYGCDFPDCTMPARSTPMALRVPGVDDPHVVRFCARHEILFATGDPTVTEWVEGAPPGADAMAIAIG